jgi:hypothetical protein
MSARPKLACAGAALIALAALAGSPARTEDLPAAIPDSELDDMRGGFIVGGLQFNFSAVMQTTVNGQLAFETQVNWTPNGEQITQTLGPNATLGASAGNTSIKGLNLQGLTPNQIATLNNGATEVVQNVTGGVVQNIVLNTASSQAISQSTQLNLSLPGFAQMQQMFQQNTAMLHLMQSAQNGLTPVLGR